jgi:hypothetical protein
MKHILVVSLFLFLTSTLSAQLKNPHFVGLNAGLSMPVGEYKNFDTARASSVNSGKYASLEGGVYISRFVGIGVNLGLYTNSINESEIKSEYEKQLVTNKAIEVKADDWLNAYAMAGIYFTIPIKKVRLDFKFLGGAVNSSQPLVTVTSNESGSVVVRESKVEDAIAFGINYGAHLRIPLVSKLYLRLNAETFTSLPEFKKETTSYRNGEKTITNENFEQTISVLNIGVGLCFSL